MSHNTSQGIQTIDSHTAGEATRLIVGGLPEIPGKTMAEKLAFFQQELDHVRLGLTREPRGHRELLAAAVTDAVSPEADFGLIYMDARRYPFLCGHATIGAVTTLIEKGNLLCPDGERTVVVDTPSGPMETLARVEKGRVQSVKIKMVPSFVFRSGEFLTVPGWGKIQAHTVCVGGFFIMVSADEIGMKLIPENNAKLIGLGMEIIACANRQLRVRHPERPEVSTVDVTEFYEPEGHEKKRGKSIVIYGEAHMDRSPCGTGTAAKLTLLHHQGKIRAGEIFTNTGPLDTEFLASIVSETRVGDRDAVEVEIEGSAHITGFHEFVFEKEDPLSRGFLL